MFKANGKIILEEGMYTNEIEASPFTHCHLMRIHAWNVQQQIQTQHNKKAGQSFLFIFIFLDSNHGQNTVENNTANIFRAQFAITVVNTKLCLESTWVLVLVFSSKYAD